MYKKLFKKLKINYQKKKKKRNIYLNSNHSKK